ncbi:MAG: cobyric acid synthase [Chloroflexi bacterium]|nr:cobyric acid synthase [Chloroflexota bacterium]
MVVGTASSVGKSVIVTALCRIFRQDGVRVAPFKAQNMSNNADVTPDGLEIGRAQSEQAAAAGIPPSVEMNPVLLKPQGDRTSQLVLDGRPTGTLGSRDVSHRKRDLWPHVERALDTLRSRFELVVAEGAGSAAEPNLRAGDIVNMRVARHAQATTLLVGDIERGGVFAHLFGTLALLSAEDRALVRGFVINRFRGDLSLLTPAIAELEQRTGVPVLGVVPWIDDLLVAQEDAVALERPHAGARAPGRDGAAESLDVAVVRLPHIANFDDFDPLTREPGVRVRFVERPDALGAPDLLVLPGTKATVADLAWLRADGWDTAIAAHAGRGGQVLGICGGFQMLGETLIDDAGVEAPAGTRVAGFGLLPIETHFTAAKETVRVTGRVRAAVGPWATATNLPVFGYEIHMGRTRRADGTRDALSPLLALDQGGDERADGAVSSDGRVAGTYMHGLFHSDAFRHSIVAALRAAEAGEPEPPAAAERSGASFADARERDFDRLADVVRAHVDLDRVRAWIAS